DGPLVGLPQDRYLRPHRLGERDDRGHQADQRADPEPHHRLRLVSRRVLGKGPPAGTRPAGLLRGPEGAQPLSTPSFAPRTKYRWKITKMIATGIVASRAAPSLSGYCVPTPSEPVTRSAMPRGSVYRSGSCTATRVCGSSFHEPWNE